MAGFHALAEQAEGHVDIFGELHGTEEMLRAFAQYVREAARYGQVLVGLDMARDLTKLTRNDLRAPRTAAADQAFLAKNELFNPGPQDLQDGRRSVAMFELLNARRPLVADDAIDLFLFDQPLKSYDFTVRDAAMAAAIDAAVVAGSYERTAVLAGNLHARKAVGDFNGETRRWMANLATAVIGKESRV